MGLVTICQAWGYGMFRSVTVRDMMQAEKAGPVRDWTWEGKDWTEASCVKLYEVEQTESTGD